MNITVPLAPHHQRLLHDLRTADRRRLKVLFRESPAPTIAELDGEYAAELLDQGTWLANWLIRRMFRSAGNWTGKAFQRIDADRGIGYNCFWDGSHKAKRLPMLTYLEETPLAGGESFILDYALTTRGIMRTMRGQVRRLQEGAYLGFGSVGPKFGKRSARRLIPFVLIGPTQPFDLPSDLLYLRQIPSKKSAA
jgi:hypothetical protein